MIEWDGKERRVERGEGVGGRRIEDQHCGEHSVLWRCHDEEKSDHRKVVCGKIAKVEHAVEKLQELHMTDIKNISSSMTPWKVFALSMGVLIVLFGWLGQEIKTGNFEIKESVGTIHRRISDRENAIMKDTLMVKDAINKVNISIQSLEDRINDIEKASNAKDEKKRQNYKEGK